MVMGSLQLESEIAIIGAGPGGYVAALRAADLDRDVVLIEEREQLGGVCLLEGCIPSKTLINAVEIAESAKAADRMGLSFSELTVDHDKLRAWSDSVITGLTQGIGQLLRHRGIEVIHGRARFKNDRELAIEGADVAGVRFRNAVIATGSRIHEIPPAIDVPVWSSAEALRLPEIPERLIVVGGGYIGLEMGLVYAGLGSQVKVVEFFPGLLQGADRDLVDIMLDSCRGRFEAILVDSKVTNIAQTSAGFVVTMDHGGKQLREECDRVLMAVGRKPNTENIGLETLGIDCDQAGQIPVDEQGRTKVPHIFAIGDAAPGPMLAHKASREAKVVAETIAEHPAAFDNRAIPAVVFTDPEIAWVGLTEQEAQEQGLSVDIGRFPLSALGRARTMGRTDGLVKVLAEKETGLVAGVGMVGPHVSEFIAEGALAIEMGATLEDLMVTIHPHPTISEAIMEAAEVAAGQAVHMAKKR